jgi:cation/acetate symporter
MVGAGVLVKPLLGLQYWHGVVMVGTIVVFIVVTAGMVSTTYVQFLKGGLLVIFSLLMTILILMRGLHTSPANELGHTQFVETKDNKRYVNNVPIGFGPEETNVKPVGKIVKLPGGVTETGPLGPISFISTLANSEIEITKKEPGKTKDSYTIVPRVVDGKKMLSPGNLPAFEGIRSDKLMSKVDFVSLMVALFAGTASLPHILIRYYTVKDQASARKSTIVGIASIGFFYVLTLYIGLGAMVSGTLDPTDSNMAAPLLAKSFSNLLFAAVSAIAFTTVLGTVSGLIIAAGGSMAHDIAGGLLGLKLNENQTIIVAKLSSIGVGVVAISLGLAFEGMNVSYLVGWAFAIAASANLPALLMLLFWKRTTKQGIIAGVIVGLVSSLLWVLVSPDMFVNMYKLPAAKAWVPLNQPGIITIPLSFIAIVFTSLVTNPHDANATS